jgi:hypothetical protein
VRRGARDLTHVIQYICVHCKIKRRQRIISLRIGTDFVWTRKKDGVGFVTLGVGFQRFLFSDAVVFFGGHRQDGRNR